LGFAFKVLRFERTRKRDDPKRKTQTSSRHVRYFRLLLWFGFFTIATFCWVVIIEHGPENFIEGAKIELENLGWLPSQFFKKAASGESTNQPNRDRSPRAR
jgi:hypothetical protein